MNKANVLSIARQQLRDAISNFQRSYFRSADRLTLGRDEPYAKGDPAWAGATGTASCCNASRRITRTIVA
jgi:hypothetical protein